MRADRAVSLARDAVSLAVQGPLRTTRSALRCGKFLRLRTFLAHEKRVCGKHHSGRGQLFFPKIFFGGGGGGAGEVCSGPIERTTRA